MSGRRVIALDVRCPACGATPGSRCRKLDNPAQTCPPHGPRTAEARRLDRIANPEHVDGQLPLIPRSECGPVIFVCRRGRR